MKAILTHLSGFKYLLLLPVLLLSQHMLAQNAVEVSGSVTSAKGEPVPFANIVVKGTNTGTLPDFDGNFTIAVGPDRDIRLPIPQVEVENNPNLEQNPGY
ncbi:carboxypeptidase-like regulatory domain-containing protein [Sinomicrobium sp. M5D2P9]